MSRHLGDEIAVLDGLDGFGMTPTGPATGRSSPSRYVAPFSTVRRNVIDPSEGGNYGGGSNWAPGMPVMPSAVGLAGDFADADLRSIATGVLPPRTNVIDPSGGALYSGGSSWTGGMPLTPSNAGLAGGLPTGRADSYADFHGLSGGPIPTGRADTYGDFASLDAYFEAAGSSMTPTGPSTGRSSPSRYITPFATVRRNVIDPSEGANYGGGSNYAPRMPLLPSTVGLAELSVADMLDAVSDNAFTRKLFANQKDAFTRVAGKNRLQTLKAQGVSAARQAVSAMSWPQRARALQKAQAASIALSRARMVRRAMLGNRVAPMRPMRTIAAA
jgi:hypothetical protein